MFPSFRGTISTESRHVGSDRYKQDQITGKLETISSPVGLVPTNAHGAMHLSEPI